MIELKSLSGEIKSLTTLAVATSITTIVAFLFATPTGFKDAIDEVTTISKEKNWLDESAAYVGRKHGNLPFAAISKKNQVTLAWLMPHKFKSDENMASYSVKANFSDYLHDTKIPKHLYLDCIDMSGVSWKDFITLSNAGSEFTDKSRRVSMDTLERLSTPPSTLSEFRQTWDELSSKDIVILKPAKLDSAESTIGITYFFSSVYTATFPAMLFTDDYSLGALKSHLPPNVDVQGGCDTSDKDYYPALIGTPSFDRASALRIRFDLSPSVAGADHGAAWHGEFGPKGESDRVGPAYPDVSAAFKLTIYPEVVAMSEEFFFPSANPLQDTVQPKLDQFGRRFPHANSYLDKAGDLSFNAVLAMLESLNDQAAKQRPGLNIFGNVIEVQYLSMIATYALSVLLFYISRHVRVLSRELPAGPRNGEEVSFEAWVGVFGTRTDRYLTVGSLIGMPVAAVIVGLGFSNPEIQANNWQLYVLALGVIIFGVVCVDLFRGLQQMWAHPYWKQTVSVGET